MIKKLLLLLLAIPIAATGQSAEPQNKQELANSIQTTAQSDTELLSNTQSNLDPTPNRGSKKCFNWDDLTLRTNLLYFAGGMFNVGAEYRISDFGYLLSVGYSPFGGDGWEHSLGGWYLAPEVRYYIPNNPQWFIAAQFLAGGYNIKLSETGYQGQVVSLVANGGYRLPLTDRFDMDFNIGLGYGSCKYDKYYHNNGINEYGSRDNKRGCILPQAGINLIWKIK